MLKKILLTSGALLTLSSSAFAGLPAPYVGAGLGINTNTSSSVFDGTTSQPAYFRGVPFYLYAGYGGQVNQCYYLAGEIIGKVATAEISNKNMLKTSYGYGASIIPGIYLSDSTIAYARAGFVRDRFSNSNDTRTGGQVGLGLQTNVTQNIDVRGEYDYTSYSTFNNNYGRVASPTSDAFNLALIYKFD